MLLQTVINVHNATAPLSPEVGARLAGVIFQLASIFVGHADDFQKQRVVRSLQARIFHGNGPMDAVPFTDEDECYFFADEGGAIGGDGNGVLEIGYVPVVALGCRRDGQDGQQEEDKQSAIRMGSAQYYFVTSIVSASSLLKALRLRPFGSDLKTQPSSAASGECATSRAPKQKSDF